MKNKKNRPITIDFLYLDLTECTRCQGTEKSLDRAVEKASKELTTLGIEVVVNKVNVNTESLAKEYQFLSSPTIRVNGTDIQLNVQEDHCDACSDLCGDEVDCRIWVYQGREYTEPPEQMIVEAILSAAEYVQADKTNTKSQTNYVLPDNLKNFYRNIAKTDVM